MRRLVWDASFRRAFKRVTRRQPLLAKHILNVLEALVKNPFEPELKTQAARTVGRLVGLLGRV
jgi:mRNA-degrading endonuclease YafQ of YafQ-DinJ toxin-antitoxin module